MTPKVCQWPEIRRRPLASQQEPPLLTPVPPSDLFIFYIKHRRLHTDKNALAQGRKGKEPVTYKVNQTLPYYAAMASAPAVT
jgi:hypothetical protein